MSAYENKLEEALNELEACKDKITELEKEKDRFENALNELGNFLEALTELPVLWREFQSICDDNKAWPVK